MFWPTLIIGPKVVASIGQLVVGLYTDNQYKHFVYQYAILGVDTLGHHFFTQHNFSMPFSLYYYFKSCVHVVDLAGQL